MISAPLHIGSFRPGRGKRDTNAAGLRAPISFVLTQMTHGSSVTRELEKHRREKNLRHLFSASRSLPLPSSISLSLSCLPCLQPPSLSLYIPLSMSLVLHLSLPFRLYCSLPPSIHQPVYPSPAPFFSSLCRSITLALSPYICYLTFYVSRCPSMYLTISLSSILLSVYPSIGASIYLHLFLPFPSAWVLHILQE